MADGTLKVGTITTSSGSGTITLGQSGETVDMSNGTMTLNSSMKMTPAFEAYLGGSGGQAVSDNTVTLVQANTEVYDTDSDYDTSTYRFTPQVAGKYMVYGSVLAETGSSSNLNENYLYIKKNGSNITEYEKNFASNPIRIDLIQVSAIIDMNGSSDYLEIFGQCDDNSGTPTIRGASDSAWTSFGAYRIGS